MATKKEKNYDFLVKLLIIGDSGVGKTSLLNRFGDDTFSPNYISTMGIDFKTKIVDMCGKKVKLQIWDTAGQERFCVIAETYYKGTMGVLMVYDITNEVSYQHIKKWVKSVHENAGDISKVILGNKADLEDSRKVLKEQGEALAKELDLPFLETSAKNSQNVQDAFALIVEEVRKAYLKKLEKGEIKEEELPTLKSIPKDNCLLS